MSAPADGFDRDGFDRDGFERDAVGGDRALPPFPPESGWLDAEPPSFGEDFVGRTLARLRDVGLVAAAADGTTDVPAGLSSEQRSGLPADLLAKFVAPAPTPGFVDRALAAVNTDRADRWRRLLLRYDAPDPTPDFVARTMAALRPAPTIARFRPLRVAFTLLAAASVAGLLLWLVPRPPAHSLRQLLASAAPARAASQSPALLSHLLAAPQRSDATAFDGDADSADAPLPVAGDWLWLAHAEARR